MHHQLFKVDSSKVTARLLFFFCYICMALEINGSSSLLKLTRIKRRSNFLTNENSRKVF